MNRPKAARPHTQRIFLALWPDDGIRQRIAEHARHWTFCAAARPYAPRDWHVTLHFLGHVADHTIAAIADGAALPIDPFELVLDRPQVWKGGLAVVCATQLPAPLGALHARLSSVLTGLGQDVDTRRYRPHLTLARHAGTSTPPRAPHAIVWPVRGYVLVASTGSPAGRYAVLRTYP